MSLGERARRSLCPALGVVAILDHGVTIIDHPVCTQRHPS